jgi:hypothetical protein
VGNLLSVPSSRVPLFLTSQLGYSEVVEQAQLPKAIPFIASNLCATVLSRGKHDGQFGMTLDALRVAMALNEPQLKVVAAWAAERDWIRWIADRIELRAAGIYVAKERLDLPR